MTPIPMIADLILIEEGFATSERIFATFGSENEILNMIINVTVSKKVFFVCPITDSSVNLSETYNDKEYQ